MEIKYIDSHVHLAGEEFQEDLDAVMARNVEANIVRNLIITLNYEETMRALEIKAKDPSRYQVAAGIFPLDAQNVTDAMWSQFEKTMAIKEVDVLGEIGLDYYWQKDDGLKALQKDLFIRQIELAKRVDKPISVHARDAMQDTYTIMKEHLHRGVLHCFAGSKEMAREFVKLGYFIALGGPVTFKNARHAVEVVEDIDLNYLLTETDAPYMAPVPMRGKRNESSYIPYILHKMAEIRGLEDGLLSQQIFENYERFVQNKN